MNYKHLTHMLRAREKGPYLSVNVFSTKKLIENTIFLQATRPPFYMVRRATRRSSCLQGKGSTFISQLFYDPKYWSDSGNRTRDQSSALPTEQVLPRSIGKETARLPRIQYSSNHRRHFACLWVFLLC